MTTSEDEKRQSSHARERAGADGERPPKSGGGSRSRTSPRNPAAGSRVPPESVEQALAQALEHARNALAEGLLAGRSLLDAASLALTGRPAAQRGAPAARSEAARALARSAALLEQLAGQVRASSPDASRALIEALLGALDSEIARWEGKARQDADARAVLRAFLGLRELLWELGMRPAEAAGSSGSAQPTPRSQGGRTHSRTTPRPARPKDGTDTSGPDTAPTARADAAPPPRRRRVQRVDVER